MGAIKAITAGIGNGMKSGDEQHLLRQMPCGMSLGSQVNMANCVKHFQHFFNRYRFIHSEELIAYWMMAGYLGPATEFYKARAKGMHIIHGSLGLNYYLDIVSAAAAKNAECNHEGFCVLDNLGFFHLLDFHFSFDKLDVASNVEFGKYVDSHVSFGKYVDHSNIQILEWESVTYLVDYEATPESLKKMLAYDGHSKAKDKNLNALLIRGCEFLSSNNGTHGGNGILSQYSTSYHFNSLTVVEISSSPCSPIDIGIISELTLLQGLNLSHLPDLVILPDNLFYKLRHLRWLIVRGCSELRSLPLSIDGLTRLEVLDLSYCTSLQLPFFLVDIRYPHLQILDLSYTPIIYMLRALSTPNLTHLFLRGSRNLKNLVILNKLDNLQVLDLSGCENLLNLSPFMNVPSLKHLNLSGCTSFKNFHEGIFDQMSGLEDLDLSWTKVKHLPSLICLTGLGKLSLRGVEIDSLEAMAASLPSQLLQLDLKVSSSQSHELEFLQSLEKLPASLQRLVLTNRSGIQKLFPKYKHHKWEFLDLRGTDVADCDSILGAPDKAKTAEIHVLYGTKSHQPSEGDDFVDLAVQSDAFIPYIQKKLNSAMTTIHTDDQAVKMQVEMLDRDLMYIHGNIEGLKNSHHWKSGEKLLQQLEDAAADLSTQAHLKQLRRVVVKLKLLVPPKDQNDSEALQITKKKKTKSSHFINNKESIGITEDMQGIMTDLLTSYKSLSQVQKQCLLCFSIFPLGEDDNKNNTLCGIKKNFLIISKKMLIYWWVGERFIVPHHQSTESETSAGIDEVNEQVSATDGVNKSKSIEETGKQILKVLLDKNFIEVVIWKGRESGNYYMDPLVHTFVIQRAKEERFFDFDENSCNLGPHFSHSRRALLLKPQDKFPSSCEFWASWVNSPENLATFQNVKTLFNVNDSMVDIKREWFSKMKNLCVLHLGNWRSENADLVEVVDQKFLEDLNRLKQLRLLSLQGLPTIMKLPDSICQLSNLIILDLKECSYLEELPVDIGSLKSLTHLDISSCPLFHKLPKGISLLSKLQVLRGFVFTEEHGARASYDRKNASILSRWFLSRSRNDDVCTLRDLLKLKLLRELSVVVNISMFPSDEEVQLFKEMKQLRKLKILWEKSLSAKHSTVNRATEQGTLTECSGWKINLKCWGHQPRPSQCDRDDTQESKHLDNIEKLELWCFPHEDAPKWLNPTELINLEKLYIVGGQLTKLRGSATDGDENPWNVKTLRLKYLPKLDIQWDALKKMFPRLTYLEKHQCDQLVTFPCDWEGVWKSEN